MLTRVQGFALDNYSSSDKIIYSIKLVESSENYHINVNKEKHCGKFSFFVVAFVEGIWISWMNLSKMNRRIIFAVVGSVLFFL